MMLRSAGLILLTIAVMTGCSSDKPEVVNETLKAKNVAGYDPNAATAATQTSIAFVSPKADFTATGKITVEVDPKNTNSSATWSLYYSNKKGGIDSGVAIVKDLPVSKKSVTWDVTFVTPGTYYLFAVLKQDGTSMVFGSDVGVTVGGAADGDRSPFIIIQQEIGNRAYKPGDQVTISFTGSDPDQDELTYKIDYSPDAGKTWKPVTKDLNNDTLQYQWTIPNETRGAQYTVRVTGDDGKGRTGSAMMQNTFGITATPVTFDADIAKVLQDNCASCHSGATPPGNFDATTFADPGTGPQGAQNKRNGIYNDTRPDAAKPMPPTGTLSQDARDLIQLWKYNNFLQN